MSQGQGTMRAALWALFATAGTRVVTLISLAVLARILAPAEFGLLAFALVYITYAETIGDLGTGVALIYWQSRRDDAAQVTFVINLAMGLFWFVLTLLLAPAIGDFFNNQQAVPLVRFLAFSFLLKFAGNTHDALAQKDLRFKARMVPEMGLALVKAAISIGFAVAGFGAWSLAWGQLLGVLTWTVGLWIIVPWRPRFAFPIDLAGPMLRYGRGIVAVNMISSVVHHADLAIVGRMLGTSALGLYQIATKIPEASIIVIVWVASKVLFPAFSRMQSSHAELKKAYLKALSYVSLITIPIAGGLFVTAEPLVVSFFGARWIDAAPILRWLAVYGGIRSIGNHAGDILKATGRSGLLAAIGIGRAVVLVPALILAARSGVVMLAMTLAGVTALTIIVNIGVVMKLLHIRVSELARALKTSLLAGAVMVAATLPLNMIDTLVPQILLALIVATGSAVYAGLVFVLDRPAIRELFELIVRRRPVAPAVERN